jgi:cation transport ATPase
VEGEGLGGRARVKGEREMRVAEEQEEGKKRVAEEARAVCVTDSERRKALFELSDASRKRSAAAVRHVADRECV